MWSRSLMGSSWAHQLSKPGHTHRPLLRSLVNLPVRWQRGVFGRPARPGPHLAAAPVQVVEALLVVGADRAVGWRIRGVSRAQGVVHLVGVQGQVVVLL